MKVKGGVISNYSSATDINPNRIGSLIPMAKVMYTLLYLKWITTKNLLYSIQNSAQCYAPAWMGGGFGGESIHIHV